MTDPRRDFTGGYRSGKGSVLLIQEIMNVEFGLRVPDAQPSTFPYREYCDFVEFRFRTPSGQAEEYYKKDLAQFNELPQVSR